MTRPFLANAGIWRSVRRGLPAALFLTSLIACHHTPALPTGAESPALATQTGTASWYGPTFNGKPTASGEIYDQNALTAAHQTLALGTHVRVVNLTNERSVVVRINDRGPFVGHRIIDLSFAAATALGMIGPGTARVRLEILDTPGPSAAISATLQYVVQIASYTQRASADALRDRAARSFSDATVIQARVAGTTYFRVRIGLFSDRAAAEEQAQRVRRAGYDAIVTEK